MKTRISLALGICIVVLAFALSLSAVKGAPPARGWLQGYVTDAVTGLPILGANVAVNDGTGTAGTTDASGFYKLNNILVGTYIATVSKPGYDTQTATITISSGATTVRNFALVPPLNAVPEVPWGTLAASLAMIGVLVGYIAIPKLRKKT